MTIPITLQQRKIMKFLDQGMVACGLACQLPTFRWYMVADADTFVYVDRLRAYLSSFNSTRPHWLGRRSNPRSRHLPSGHTTAHLGSSSQICPQNGRPASSIAGVRVTPSHMARCRRCSTARRAPCGTRCNARGTSRAIPGLCAASGGRGSSRRQATLALCASPEGDAVPVMKQTRLILID